MPNVQHKRGTRSALDALAASSGLLTGQLYVITDEDRIAIATSANAYEAFAKEIEAGGGGFPPPLQVETLSSSVSAVDFDLPAEYSRFRLIMSDVDMTGTYAIFRFSVASSFIITGSYIDYIQEQRVGSATVAGTNIATNTGLGLTQNANTALNGEFDINLSAAVASVHGDYTGGDGTFHYSGFTRGYLETASKADGLRVTFFSVSNTVDGGTIALYPYEESV